MRSKIQEMNALRTDGIVLICVAAQMGRAECLQQLIAAGGDVDKADTAGRTPILFAAEKGHAECLQLLIAAGGVAPGS